MFNPTYGYATPSPDQIYAESLQLDVYGTTVSKLADNWGIDLNKAITGQRIKNPLIDAMAEEGWCYAGAGYFSIVFVKDGLALKVGLKIGDMGLMYTAWARANQGRAGVPVIHALTKFSNCYLVLSNRYDELPSSKDMDDDQTYELRCVRDAANKGELRGHNRFDTVTTAHAIHEFFVGTTDFDCHRANVMQDGEGNLVITDPLGFSALSASFYDDMDYYTATA